MLSGLAASGNFGFAVNLHDGMQDDMEAASYLDVTKRFPMINPVNRGKLYFLEIEERAPIPIGSWYVLENSWATKNCLNPCKVTQAVSSHVQAVIDTPNGRIFKPWEKPILGENVGAAGLSPALALGRALAPATRVAFRTDSGGNKKPHKLRFCCAGNDEQRRQFYTGFCQMADV